MEPNKNHYQVLSLHKYTSIFTSALFLCGFSHLGGVDDLMLIFERRDSDATGGLTIFFLNTGFVTSTAFSFFS